ncbi:hypothetical protein GC163_22610 [bacterium]|nr:hypothetical protein [bacterium]
MSLCLGVDDSVLAAAPDVTALYPAGGRRGSEVVVKLEGKVDPASLQLRVNVPGIELIGPEGKDSVKLRIAEDAPLGPVWLTFYNPDGVSTQRPFVIGQLPESLESEPNNKQTGIDSTVDLPLVMNGVLAKSGDVDTFAVSLKAGETLVAMLDALQTFGSPMDGLLQVADEAGFVIAQNDDAPDFDPRVTMTAPRDGRYFVRVFAFPAAPDSSIRFSGAATYVYRLTLTTGPVITRWSPPAITAATGTTLKGHGWNTLEDGHALEITAAAAGVLPVSSPDVSVASPVWVSAFPVTTAAGDNTRETPQSITLPICITGQLLTRKAEQAWKFTGTKGQKVHLRLATRSLNSPLDAVVQIFDATGKRLQQYDDAVHGDAEIDTEFTLPADGDFTVSIGERFWHAGGDYIYACELSPSQPDIELTVAANSYLLKPGESLEIPVSIDRRRGMNQAVQITAVDLPEGVTADPVVSEAKGDSSKSVKLVLKSTRTEPWLGALLIVGTTQDEAKHERRASVAPVARQTVAPEVVLHVLPVKP